MADCTLIQRQIMDYIDGTLSDEDMSTFISHVENCDECKNELNIYYTIYLGLRQLDFNEEDIEELNDVDSALEEHLENNMIMLKRKHRVKIFSYILYTLVFWSVIVSFLLQFQIFRTFGLF